MSQQNVEVVRKGFTAWERGDLEGLLATFDDNVITRPIIGPERHGPEGVLEITADWIEGFEEFTMTAEEFIDGGDGIVVRVRQEAREASAGVPVQATFWFVYFLRDGKVFHFEMFRDRAQALETVGLPPET
jgi:ketosteroid isomerase-like protein